ncbi:uncharacterized protein EV154DRAFT_574694 [Mucor mucedo]|uniref:uncharacterized protein n=1 Tax=Mucor mucedo TaxID=29922 RepID=UPI00221F48FA|nr:uncharacterized protein EV154DRAFT_574694 [Mucor mucedo]KAI7884115.1 hypothetical protein EV154DRAFT_574694 [Mucor mucedo]
MRFQEQSTTAVCHLALRLPEIVNHILSYLAVPYHYDETNKTKIYQYIHPCLLVNSLWHDCATRLIWRAVTFEDSKSEYEAFLKFAGVISNSHINHKHTISHHSQYANAIRSIALRKIKDKTINEPLQQISRHSQKLEKLDIYICDHLADSSVHNFITNNHHSLTYLSLAGCNRITDDAVLSVAKNCPKLEHLDLRACGLISDISIQAIAMNCPDLHHLNVGRVRDREKITMQSIRLVAENTKVAVLGLAGCDMTDECLIALAKCRGRGLERISVNNCYRITNKSVQAYVKYCPNLSVFEMKECHWIDDWSSVAELVQRKVLLTLCDQQNRACTEWARQRGRVMEVKAPVK